MNKYLIIATPEELALPAAKEALAKGRVALITGIGGANVIRALADLPRESDILNVGYCGSPSLPAGTEIHIGSVRTFHPGVDFPEETFYLDAPPKKAHLCLTAGDFVTGAAGIPEGAVVDMELAYVAALGFVGLSAVKYVSDNLSLQQYQDTIEEAR